MINNISDITPKYPASTGNHDHVAKSSTPSQANTRNPNPNQNKREDIQFISHGEDVVNEQVTLEDVILDTLEIESITSREDSEEDERQSQSDGDSSGQGQHEKENSGEQTKNNTDNEPSFSDNKQGGNESQSHIPQENDGAGAWITTTPPNPNQNNTKKQSEQKHREDNHESTPPSFSKSIENKSKVKKENKEQPNTLLLMFFILAMILFYAQTQWDIFSRIGEQRVKVQNELTNSDTFNKNKEITTKADQETSKTITKEPQD